MCYYYYTIIAKPPFTKPPFVNSRHERQKLACGALCGGLTKLNYMILLYSIMYIYIYICVYTIYIYIYIHSLCEQPQLVPE